MKSASVLTGSDEASLKHFVELKGMRIGFIGNHTSRLSNGTPTHLALSQSVGIRVGKLFSPEHGAFGLEDREDIVDDIDPATKLPILSLYGANRKPTPEMLSGLDALVFEIQDIGARFYTYASTMLLCLEAAFEAGIRLIVLDRPNPITGTRVEGPVADADSLSFVACHTIPIRHGLTLGELATLVAAERGWSKTLTVAPCEGCSRNMWWDETQIPWIGPSPAMPSLETAIIYPGVCLLEQTNVSVGRGTDAPFLYVGAPWIDGEALKSALQKADLQGVDIQSREFTPNSSKFDGERCNGVALTVTDRAELDSVRLGFALITSLRDIYGSKFEMPNVQKLLANQSVYKMLLTGKSLDEITRSYLASTDDWTNSRKPYLLY